MPNTSGARETRERATLAGNDAFQDMVVREAEEMNDYTATYSPEDNKLRLYAASRLPRELYEMVKGHGFKWAPKQELFVAPMWTPAREDFLLTLVDDIDDEDVSLVDRAETRADRFDDYSQKRRDDAERAREAVAHIADNIPFGQPILVGHHSERRARKDAERIDAGMRKTVRLWEQSKYWRERAEGAIRHAKYKERPDVRARRIKTIEADRRRQERAKVHAETAFRLWTREGLTLEEAIHLAGHTEHGYLTLPRKTGDREEFHQNPTAYTVLTNAHPTLYAPRTLAEVVDVARVVYPRLIAHAERWIAHYDNRLEYERAMLAEQGGTVADKNGPEKGGAVRCWCSPGFGKGWSYIQKVNKVSVTVLDNHGSSGRNFTRTIRFDEFKAVMTAAEVREAKEAGRLHETAEGLGFYLDEPAETHDEAKQRAHREAVAAAEAAEAARFESLKSVKVETVAAPQLFPTPADLAAEMIDAAGLAPGQCVLEPSAGTGHLLRAISEAVALDAFTIHAVEINHTLAGRLAADFPSVTVHHRDFLDTGAEDFEPFDRVIMNPPFGNAADVKHINHAAQMLRPGGRLVALCLAGSRQRAQLEPIADRWEELPADSFHEQGTDVRVALVVISREHEPEPVAYIQPAAVTGSQLALF